MALANFHLGLTTVISSSSVEMGGKLAYVPTWRISELPLYLCGKLGIHSTKSINKGQIMVYDAQLLLRRANIADQFHLELGGGKEFLPSIDKNFMIYTLGVGWWKYFYSSRYFALEYLFLNLSYVNAPTTIYEIRLGPNIRF
ncbi:MAG: hypothetical protein HQK53_11255 [Oligoflexia bacterium]|nr:hypothetical protein [Oligoflexia bacterium]